MNKPIHVVEETFWAFQYPKRTKAIGVQWEVVKDQKTYRFKLRDRPRIFYIDVAHAIQHAKDFPPLRNAKGFLYSGKATDILIIPLYLVYLLT